MPWMSVEDLIGRAREWFVHYHRDDWPEDDRPPDLHMYFPAKGGRCQMLVGEDWRSPEDVVEGRFGVWRKDSTCAFAGAPVPGSEMPPDLHGDRLLRHLGLAGRHRVAVGLWFRLQREPKPRTLLGPLLEEIDRAMGREPGTALAHAEALLGRKLRRPPVQLVLALGYPGPEGEERWLFLRSELSSKGVRWSRQESLARVQVESYEAAPVTRGVLQRRIQHVASGVEGKQVLVFGQGALGGSVSMLLAKSGLGHLRIVDGATLRPGNAVRHEAGLTYAGWKKTAAVQHRVRDHAPDCHVRTEEPTWDPDNLREWLGEADAVVDATANPAFSLLLNEIALRAGTPIVYVACHRRAAVGTIRVVRPGQDACLVCYEGGYAEEDEYPWIPPADEGEFLEEGCGSPATEASALDIEATANHAVRAILRLLRDELGEDDHCLVINEPLDDVDGILASTGVHWQRYPPLAGCRACGQTREAA
jgi:molybdopterin/thiamine biosynthesis adenylyltransferase